MTDPATSPAPAAGISTGTRAAVGASGAVVLTLVDQFFRAGGEDAGDFLARLGPVPLSRARGPRRHSTRPRSKCGSTCELSEGAQVRA